MFTGPRIITCIPLSMSLATGLIICWTLCKLSITTESFSCWLHIVHTLTITGYTCARHNSECILCMKLCSYAHYALQKHSYMNFLEHLVSLIYVWFIWEVLWQKLLQNIYKWSTMVQNPRRACKLSSLLQHGVVQTLDYNVARHLEYSSSHSPAVRVNVYLAKTSVTSAEK